MSYRTKITMNNLERDFKCNRLELLKLLGRIKKIQNLLYLCSDKLREMTRFHIGSNINDFLIILETEIEFLYMRDYRNVF